MNSESEPSEIEEKNFNPSLSFFSLPDDIIMNCLARISPSYYPKLTLVSKTFGSLVSSFQLHKTRFLQKTHEQILYVCFQFPTKTRSLSWFSLWLKPNQTLTNDLEKKQECTGNALLVPIPSSYCPRLPRFICKVGSECYIIKNRGYPSFDLSVKKTEYGNWLDEVPNMAVAREDPIACVVDGKIYVMGGCKGDESKNWAEFYDTNTQTWESLPDPGHQLRFSTLRRMQVKGKKIYVKSSKKNDQYDVYDTKEGRWEVVGRPPRFECSVGIENVKYCYGDAGFLWYDEKRNSWRTVKGLFLLDRHCRGGSGNIEMANYGGKLLMIWDKFVHARNCYEKNIWCALIAFERRNVYDEVWGNVEWANSVLTVPISCVLLRRVIISL